MNIVYEEIKPSAGLQPYVDSYWQQTFSDTNGQVSPEQRCVPFGMTELIVHLDDNHCEVCMNGVWSKLPKIFLAGIYRDAVLWRSPGNTRKFGIRLKPETFHMLFKAPASKLFSDYTSFDNLEVKDALPLAEKLGTAKTLHEAAAIAEQYLMQRLRQYSLENNYLIEAVRIIRQNRGDISIEELSRSVSVSPRQLQRTFKDQFGTSPKTYLRIIRFSNAYKDMFTLQETEGWAGLSYYLGYSDQAHFIREFKEFSGTMPKVMLLNEGQIFGKVS